MAETEISIIAHLLEVEQNASSLIRNVQSEADKRLAAARIKADAEYKEKYEKFIKEFDTEYSDAIAKVTQEYKLKLTEYISSIRDLEQDTDCFNSFVRKVLTGK